MKKKTLFTVILVMVAAMTVAPEVWDKDVQAQEEQNEFTLEEITVTATKRETALEDTPLAISVVTGDMINEQGRNDIYDVLKDIPGLNFGADFGEGAVINLRGISGGILIESHGDPGVATNVDGGYASPLVSNPLDVGFYDVARVELLRGPQGTLYGRNAEAGVLNVVTSDPSNTLETSGTIEVGNYHLLRGTGMVNSPLTDHTAMRIAFNYNERDSYFTSGAGAVSSTSGRLKYLYQPSDTLRFLVGVELSKQLPSRIPAVIAWGLGDYPAGDPYDNLTRDAGKTGSIPSSFSRKEKYTKLWAQGDWETPIGTVTFLPSYYGRKSQGVTSNQRTFVMPYTYRIRTSSNNSDQNSFEARLASKGESAFDYVLGIFYLDAMQTVSWRDEDTNVGFVGDDYYEVGQGSKAVFGQGTFDLTGRLRGTLGLRYTRDTKGYYTKDTSFGLGGENRAEKEWTRTDWKVGVEMNIFEDGLVYADVATGYRPGSANIRASATALDAAGNVIEYPNMFSEPEKLTAYEMGAKTLFFNKRLTVNLDAYFYDYTNRQYTELLPGMPLDQLCPTGTKPVEELSFIPGTGLCYMERNMGKVEAYGAELSSVMRPTDNDTINFSTAYLNAYVAESQIILVGFDVGPGGVVSYYADVNGEKMPHSPEWQVNLSYEHRFDFEPGSLFLRGDGRYESESFVQDFSYLKPVSKTINYRYPIGVKGPYSYRDLYTCEAHTSYDFTATFMLNREGGYTVSAYVKNITDKYWKTRTDGDINTAITAPRTYGGTFSVRF